MTTGLWIASVVVAAALGWFLRGAFGSGGGDPRGELLRALAADLDAGRRPQAGPDAPPEMAVVREALERHWAPRTEEREQALREALGRIAAFLREGVRDPLRGSLGRGPAVQREAIETAVGAVQDLEFFLREPLTPDETHDLIPVVQQVTREFTGDWDIAVRMSRAAHPVRAHIHEDTFMDAVYLLLHNAGQFGGGQTIDVAVTEEGDEAVVTIGDRGPGFSPEALERAHDLFYSTTEAGLGLGIPFARKIVESFGGSLDLRNLDDGGAEVRLAIPAA